ncbi:putative ribonuclease H-like domain-containing protein [Tanacetum coccineum]
MEGKVQEVQRTTEDQIPTAPLNEMNIWNLYTDRASNDHGSGACLILIDSEGVEYPYTLRLNFTNSNNDSEYKALLAGLRIAAKMKVLRSFSSASLFNQYSNSRLEYRGWSQQNLSKFLNGLHNFSALLLMIKNFSVNFQGEVVYTTSLNIPKTKCHDTILETVLMVCGVVSSTNSDGGCDQKLVPKRSIEIALKSCCRNWGEVNPVMNLLHWFTNSQDKKIQDGVQVSRPEHKDVIFSIESALDVILFCCIRAHGLGTL